MKTFAQLKRDIQEGTTIKTIYNAYKQEKNGQVRRVCKVQSNAIAFEQENTDRPSWLWWSKAKNYEYDGNIFKVYEEPNEWNGNKRVLSFVYEILSNK